MDAFTLVGLIVILYIFFYIVILAYADCDALLFLYQHFGTKSSYFKDKVVWITGASRGIGEALAIELAKNSAKLILTARNIADLERVKNECLALETCGFHDILLLPMDVTDLFKHEEAFLTVIKNFGKLDILINNAGRSQRAFWEDINIEVDKQMFDLNVFSVVNLSRIAVRYFKKVGKGHIVVMSSLAGVFSPPLSGTYCGTKHALHGYFKGLFAENLGSSFNITLLCPGPTFSNLLNECFTATPGEKFGEHMKSTDKRLTAERCAQLSLIAIANNLSEAWMGIFPVLPLCYTIMYHPNFAVFLAKWLGTAYLQNIRDSRQTIKTK